MYVSARMRCSLYIYFTWHCASHVSETFSRSHAAARSLLLSAAATQQWHILFVLLLFVFIFVFSVFVEVIDFHFYATRRHRQWRHECCIMKCCCSRLVSQVFQPLLCASACVSYQRDLCVYLCVCVCVRFSKCVCSFSANVKYLTLSHISTSHNSQLSN